MDYDLLVIGAGPGGYEAAIRGAQLKMRVALVEKDEVGGTCLNRGCIPTKSLLHDLPGEDRLEEMVERKDEVVSTLRNGVEMLISKNKITLIKGVATLTGEKEVTVNDQRLTAEHILIATGSMPQRPPIEGLDLEDVITSDELLSLTEQPMSMGIIGGGVIGVEFATVFAGMGTKVVMLEALERILPLMDREISQNLSMLLKKQGAEIHTATKVLRIEKQDALTIVYEEKGEEKRFTCEKILVATGRKPNTRNLFGEGIAPEMNRGFLVVDDAFQTSVKGVYAIGDVIGGMMLAHQASAQGIACVQMLAGLPKSQDLAVIPACVYTSPEIACVGLTQDEAKAQGIETVVGKYIMGGNGRTVIENGARGFVKIVARKDNGLVIGAQFMCERATDMIAEMTTAIVNGLTYHQLARGIRPHPTFTEGIQEALHAIDGCAIHVMPAR